MSLQIEAKSPELAYSDERVKRLLQSVNEASAAASAGWVLFISAMAYFFVALAGVTHQDFLLNTAVNQPVLQVEVDLQSFFLFAPLVLVFVHFGILIQHEMLSSKARALDHALLEYEGMNGYRMHPMRRELHGYFFTQSIAGPRRSRLLLFFLNVMSWTTLFLMPIITLLAFQITYLPYHDATTTFWHRVYLVADLAIFLVMRTLYSFLQGGFFRGLSLSLRYNPMSFMGTNIVSALAVFFAFCVATLPDSTLDKVMAQVWPTPVPYSVSADNSSDGPRRVAFFPTAYLFEGAVDEGNSTTKSFFSRNLVVTDRDLVKDKDWNPKETTLSLRARNLSYATFDRTDLRGTDFTRAILHGARFYKSDLSSVKFDYAELYNADLREASFSGEASLYRAKLDGADLRNSVFNQMNMREASLVGAKMHEFGRGNKGKWFLRLEGANLRDAQLQRANMEGAELRGADLRGANLQGANLLKASLTGADLSGANMAGIHMVSADLKGALLIGANLQGASLEGSSLHGVDFKDANLTAAYLRGAGIWMTRPLSQQQIALVDLSDLNIKPERSYYGEYKTLQFIKSDEVRKVVQSRLGLLLNHPKKIAWKGTPQYQAWQKLNNVKADADKVSDFFAQNVCADTTKDGFIAKAYVFRVDRRYANYSSSIDYSTYRAPVNPDKFLNMISEENCVGAKSVTPTAMYQLMSTAASYRQTERKINAWRAKQKGKNNPSSVRSTTINTERQSN